MCGSWVGGKVLIPSVLEVPTWALRLWRTQAGHFSLWAASCGDPYRVALVKWGLTNPSTVPVGSEYEQGTPSAPLLLCGECAKWSQGGVLRLGQPLQ